MAQLFHSHSKQRSGSWLLILLATLPPLLMAVVLGQAQLVKEVNLFPILLIAVISGFSSGAALGKSNFPKLTAFTYATVYALFTVAFALGRTYDDVNMIWRDRIADIIGQQIQWGIGLFNSGDVGRDGFIFASHTCMFSWVLAYISGWGVTRGAKVWRVILPIGIVIANVVYNYRYGDYFILYFAIFCLVALLYIVQNHLEYNQAEWDFRRIAYDTFSITNAFLWAGLGVSVIALAFAWVLPTFSSVESLENLWKKNEPVQLIQSKFEELYGDVNPGGSGLGSNTSFSSRMDFGGPRNLGNEPIMKVQVAAPLQEPYWRWESKDIYASNGWESLADEVFEQDVTKPDLPVTNRIVRRPVKQLFTNLRPRQDMLFYAPDVVSSNIEMWVRQIRLPDGSIQVTTLQPLLRLDEGDQYEMTSMQVAATEADLRAASVRTSSTIETIYLQLPSSVTPRTRQLAIDITAGLNNDYDKAIAIRDYLRTNIRYNDQIAAPPSGVDPVDYLLFELGEGYCDYYATAMAVLLRSVGVPSRISRGYASGSYAPHPSGSYGTYTVLEKDAHSWPEVYFEGHGWVIFEPTSAYNTINRESGETADAEPTAELATPTSEPTKTPTPSPEKDAPANPKQPETDDDGSSLPLILGALGLIGAAATMGFFFFQKQQEEARTSGVTDTETGYALLMKWAKRLGLPIKSTQTPYEQADMIAKVVPDGRQSIQDITHAYVESQYSLRKGTKFTERLQQAWNLLLPLFHQKKRNK